MREPAHTTSREIESISSTDSPTLDMANESLALIVEPPGPSHFHAHNSMTNIDKIVRSLFRLLLESFLNMLSFLRIETLKL